VEPSLGRHHEVIHKRNANELARAEEPGGEGRIISAWRHVTGWMVVAHDDGARVGEQRGAEHVAWLHHRGVHGAARELMEGEHVPLRGKAEDDAHLHHLRANETNQQGGGILGTPKGRYGNLVSGERTQLVLHGQFSDVHTCLLVLFV